MNEKQKDYLKTKRVSIIDKCKVCQGADPFCMCKKEYDFEIQKVQANIPIIFLDVKKGKLGLNELQCKKIKDFLSGEISTLYIEQGNSIQRSEVLSAIMQEIIKLGKRTEYISSLELSQISTFWFSDRAEDYQKLLTLDCTVFSDVGSERKSEKGTSEQLIASVLKERMFSGKQTIISSEMKIEEFFNFYLKNDNVGLMVTGVGVITLFSKINLINIFKDIRS